jgi:phosphohistidine phosphatase
MSAARDEEASGRVRLHMLRHASAGDPAEWVGDDALRPLTRKGRRQSERLGTFLDEHGIRPDVIVSSPLVRAQQTAELVAAALGMTVRRDERLAGDFGRRELWELLRELGAREPMLVGHDPDFSELLGELIGGRGISLRKGSLATLDLEPDDGSAGAILCWLIPPELLAPE